MSRFRSILVLMMMALWLPASSHVFLQTAGLIHSDHSEHTASHHHDSDDADQHGGSSHDLADGQCRTEVGSVSVPMPIAHFTYACSVAFHFSLNVAFAADMECAGPSPPTTSPPELKHRWQFALRTALPARAPSFVS